MMLRSILVPLDGSSFGEHALPVACQIARRPGGMITLAHVHVPLIHVSLGGWNMGDVPIVDARMDAEQCAYERTYLESLCTRFADDDLTITGSLLAGPVVPTLVDYAAETNADLVVMTTHGHGAFSRVWLGSVADGFVRHSSVPTLLIRPTDTKEQVPTDTGWTPRRMLIPLDGSALAEQILEPAQMLGDLLDLEYWLLRVVEPFAAGDYPSAREVAELEQEFPRSRHSEAHAYLAGIAAALRERGRTVHTDVTVAQQPARAILHAIQQSEIDLVALATHGYGGLRRLMLGSVADKVVRGAETPVLLVHPQGQQPDSTDK